MRSEKAKNVARLGMLFALAIALSFCESCLTPLLGLMPAMKLLDRWNMLPKAIIDASPFHTSVFITYLKSVGINGIYHHIYDFGTTGMFLGVGKEIIRPVVDEETGEVRPGKVVELKVVADERFCDGMYHAVAMRQVRKYLKNPTLLEQRLETVEKDID